MPAKREKNSNEKRVKAQVFSGPQGKATKVRSQSSPMPHRYGVTGKQWPPEKCTRLKSTKQNSLGDNPSCAKSVSGFLPPPPKNKFHKVKAPRIKRKIARKKYDCLLVLCACQGEIYVKRAA